MWRTLFRGSLSILAASVGVAIAPSAFADSAGGYTVAQISAVVSAMQAQGATAAQIAYLKANPDLASQIPVSSSFETSVGGAATVSVADSYSGTFAEALNLPDAVPDSVGSTCSGYSGWVQRIQYVNNETGQHLANITLHTDFCYNYSSVTYASTSKTYHIYTLGSTTGVIEWDKWSEFSEGFYAYNNHTNGGVKTTAQGTFKSCFAFGHGCWGSYNPIARTYAHYDGTWYTSGSS